MTAKLCEMAGQMTAAHSLPNDYFVRSWLIGFEAWCGFAAQLMAALNWRKVNSVN